MTNWNISAVWEDVGLTVHAVSDNHNIRHRVVANQHYPRDTQATKEVFESYLDSAFDYFHANYAILKNQMPKPEEVTHA